MIEFRNPRDPPDKNDLLSHGPDCCRHGLFGNIIANNGTPPHEQVRSFLWSLYNATEQQLAGRAGDLSAAEYRECLRKLEEWEKTNTVWMPTPMVGHPLCLEPKPKPPPSAPGPSPAGKFQLEQAAKTAAAHSAAKKLADETAAMVERLGNPIH